MIVQRFNLNLIPNQSPVVVHVNQYDTGTDRLVATLYEGNEPYSPNGTAVIQGTKPDGHGFQYTATLDGNVVTADLTEQMSPVAGDVRAQIVVTESSGVTGTFAFIIRVQPSALPSDTDMSESDYPLIEEAIREAQEAVERAQEAITETQENAENSEAWAQGTRGGIPVGPTDPTYEHNAEYWAQYAERYAQGGLHYKASIPFVDIPTTGMREGDMYDITDDFTTDSRFTEGAGIKVKGGTNIAWNSDNKWDILALPYIPKTTFNGRSGSILPMAGDYDSKKILLSSALHIGGETQNDVQEALEALSNDGVKSFNGRSGSVLPTAGDYSAEQVNYDSNQTVKQKIDALVTKEASDIAGQQSLLKDTVGWTGKNLCDITKKEQVGTASISYNNTEITMISAATYSNYQFGNYIPAGDYILSVDVKSSNSSQACIGVKKGNVIEQTINFGTSTGIKTKSISIPSDNTYRVCVFINLSTANDSTIVLDKIMLRKADITDPTYEPYHESVQNQLNAQGVLGAKNLLKNNAVSTTVNGITYTVNADGTIKANGTATADAYIAWDTGLTLSIEMNEVSLPTKSGYTISSCDDATGEKYFIGLSSANRAYIVIKNGTTVSNKMFYPMLRLASDPDDTYQPYAMTNRELTEKKINIADLKTVVSASSDFADFKTRIASL